MGYMSRQTPEEVFAELYKRHPRLSAISEQIEGAYTLLRDSFASGGKLLVAGNGGSAADAGHIAGELLKRFRMRRDVPASELMELAVYEEEGAMLAAKLEGALPVISLPDQTAILTAIGNDTGAEFGFAQLVYAYGQPGDTFLSISTSGNAKNLVHASRVAKMKGMCHIVLTGELEGALDATADVSIHVPERETAFVQELHLPIYHAIAAALESFFFRVDFSEM